MNDTNTRAEKIAKATPLIGIVIVLLMPFLSVPFHVPYPVWALTPMEHSICLFIVSLLVLIVGSPASIIAIRRKRRRIGWLSLIGCVVIWPIGIVAIYIVAFLFGENINIQ